MTNEAREQIAKLICDLANDAGECESCKKHKGCPDSWDDVRKKTDSVIAKFEEWGFRPRPKLTLITDRPRVVCLCGSGRFRTAFEDAEYRETLSGKIVLTIGCNAHDIARSGELSKYKPMLDELHLWKIDLADEVLILNVGGYIGESTARELAYAQKKGKTIRYLESAQLDHNLREG